MKVAINGMGIAGPALAYWLHRFGHKPTLIEKASAPRKGGYLIDCWKKLGFFPTCSNSATTYNKFSGSMPQVK
jgi:protoporphyrinogen oxidase